MDNSAAWRAGSTVEYINVVARSKCDLLDQFFYFILNRKIMFHLTIVYLRQYLPRLLSSSTEKILEEILNKEEKRFCQSQPNVPFHFSCFTLHVIYSKIYIVIFFAYTVTVPIMICKGGTRETFGYIPKEVVAVLRDVFAERDLNGTEASLFSPCLSTAPSRVSCAGDFQTMAEAVELPILGYPVTNHGGRLVGRVVVEVKTRTVHDNMKDSSSNRCCHVVGYSHGAAMDTCCSQALVITPRRYSLLNSSDGTMTNAEEENDVYDPQYVHIEWGLTAGDDTENTCTKSQSLLMPFVGTWLQPSRRIFYSPPLPAELSSVDAVRSAHTNRSIEILTKGASGKVSTPDDDNRLPPIFIHGWRSAYLSTAKLDVENQKQNDTKIEIRQLVNPGNEVSQSAVATVQAMWKEHLRASISLSLQDELNKEAQKRKLNATLASRRLRSLVCALRSQLRQTLGLCHQSTSTHTVDSKRRWLSSAEMHGIRYVNERKTDEGATFTGCAQAKVYEFDEQMRQAAIKLARPLGQGLFERHGCRNQNVHMTVVAAIPLGTDCTAAQCIRSITNNVDNQSWRTHGLPFDWIRTTPYGIGRVLTALITTVCQKHSGEWDKIHKTSRVLESIGTKMTDSRSQLRLPFRQSHRTGGGKEGLQDGSSMTDECVRVVAHERNTNNYFTTNTESTAELFLYDQEYGFVGSQQELAGNRTTLGSERFERRLQRLKEVLQNQSYQQKK